MSNQYFETPEDALAHFGVKGMKWGVRKDIPEGVSAKTNREAKKDAEEFARAKLFYGEGAGNRRKLIKATVNAKSERSASYKKAFDHHLAKQDLSKHAEKAKSERRRKDVVGSTTKTARGVHRQLTGGFGTVSLASAGIAGAYLYARNTGLDKRIGEMAKTTYKSAKSNRSNLKAAEDFLKNMGL